ncbi:MAG: bifunctional phosphoribosylaminoimidazolecarboxamide formyltransferase/IMP cyclohydrolase [bacterium]|nr:bifunctional phosphoribosylaminoimidazolecarboxamide formyltransferase/IMP cyclohydrolase [bacterium]
MAANFALVSVFDKTGVSDLVKVLVSLGYKIISTGGTAKTLTEANIPVIPIQEITGNPESFDGRMKTISFQIESGILFDRQNPSHCREAKKLGIKPIDIVVCNLYPFEQTIAKRGVLLGDAVENIDVGGPTMVRAAAKNFGNVLVVVDPWDYPKLIKALKADKVTDKMRKELAAKAFAHLSFYDSQIARFLGKGQLFPKELTIPGRKTISLRYGENPQQKAAFYLEPNSPSPLGKLQKLWGRDLSLINLTDINAGLESVRPFNPRRDGVAAVVVKHNSPCGIALGSSSAQALGLAIEADPESAFGGVIVLNHILDLEAAKIIAAFRDKQKGNIDIIAAPKVKSAALKLLQAVRKSMGIYTFGSIAGEEKLNTKWVGGGFILQTADNVAKDGFLKWRVVTKKKPTRKQLEQMKIAWKFITRIRSNSVIVVDKDLPMTRGIGSGQTSRFRSTKIALAQAGKHVKGAILGSDSFFPFPDSVKEAAKYGIGAIVQQGDSINDQASIDEANRVGIPMVFTGRRAFWH